MTIEEEEKVRVLLKAIVDLGGNLSDDRFTDRTGPNDAVARGLKYIEARRLARKALKIMYAKYAYE